MLPMKQIAAVFALIFALSAPALRADALYESFTSKDLESILTGYTFVSGDHSWSGGMKSNMDTPNATLVDVNSAYCVFRAKENGATKPLELAKQIRDGLVSKFHLAEPKSWEISAPKGISADDFGMSYVLSCVDNGSKQLLYVTVQVVRIGAEDFGITVSYTFLK